MIKNFFILCRSVVKMIVPEILLIMVLVFDAITPRFSVGKSESSSVM